MKTLKKATGFLKVRKLFSMPLNQYRFNSGENEKINCKKRNLPLLMFLFFFSFTLRAWSADFKSFGLITVSPDFELKGQGKNIDSVAFWEAQDPDDSLLFVTAKENSMVEVWKFPFINKEQNPIRHTTFNSSKVNGVAVDQDTDLLYVTIAAPTSITSVFKLPFLNFFMEFGKEKTSLGKEPNLALLKLSTRNKRIYISADDIVYIHDSATGLYLGEFIPLKGLETIAADDYYQVLYIPDENSRTGVYAYDAEGLAHKRFGTSRFGGGSVFEKDGEGIVLYFISTIDGKDTGEGLIIVADQRKPLTDFEVFDRKSWVHLGAFRIQGVSNTDGIASTQQALPGYYLGIFAAVNDNSSVVCVGWDRIFEATGLKLQ